MKKFLLLSILSTGLVFNSCSKNDDDDEPVNEFSLVGIWQPSREIAVSGSNGVTISNEMFQGCYLTSTYDFKSNNSLVINLFESNTSGSCVSTGIVTLPYSYDHPNKKLVIDNENVEIISRTKNEIQLVDHYEDVNGDNIDDKIIFVLVKI
ncbi:lipocalin family protein [Chryseobacterium sp. GP-SGM7]|uniref:lipocalin family protein n=1 Tax=Chryseobacterium sp. GP-SGM7 TaxID=3411323 RepID=UPI003B92AA57